MSAASIVLLAVTLRRAAELVLARHNTSRLVARGAQEAAPGHYPFVVLLHAAWLGALWIYGRDQPVDAIAAGGYGILQLLRIWTMASLGARWTTRIMVLPGQPLVASGPYRFLSHPNYVVVAAEIALLPLALHLPRLALTFSVLNALVLAVRIRAEDRALAACASDTTTASP
ncbi:MAG: isoprenylcysteine carboxylmethyltransferase family protein [Xanthobacteraceae bacterium]|nr:isoprenylcysteine carboxylmethyltransferase family protein [Xanthobacteraceae bacterium]